MSTDIIVGFPGETDDDFERTLEVAAAAEYDYAYTFIFSPRPGTEAADMADRFVDPAVAAERFARLRVVIERSALAKHEARVGRVEEVLVEGPSKRDPSVTSGRTRQNKLVHFRADGRARRQLRAGRGHAAPPHHLEGRLVEVVAQPGHRTRIPVPWLASLAGGAWTRRRGLAALAVSACGADRGDACAVRAEAPVTDWAIA